jgi:uncharacterized LabA/DUF88 family protein
MAPQIPTLRTIAYIDGFNLYNRALKTKPRCKWLNLRCLIENILGPQNRLTEVKYYTAWVSGRTDPGQPIRQQAYIDAIKTLPGVSVYFGKFLDKEIWRPLVNAPCSCKPCRMVKVHDTEEKGSDVNLASHLVWDGFQNRYDVAVVVSKDTDLVEPIRIIRNSGKTVGIICPDGSLPPALNTVANFTRHIQVAHLANSQLANPVVGYGGKAIHRPPEWA